MKSTSLVAKRGRSENKEVPCSHRGAQSGSLSSLASKAKLLNADERFGRTQLLKTDSTLQAQSRAFENGEEEKDKAQ
ncbi:MAG TPA: hypothetical protein VFA68_01395 [Terriglobales bacterium]|nr:hypothetical protein [Terriglobales bacterium]